MKILLTIIFISLLTIGRAQKNRDVEFVVGFTNNSSASVGLQFKDVSSRVGSGQSKTFKKRILKNYPRFPVLVYLPDSTSRDGYGQHVIRIFSDSQIVRKITVDGQNRIVFHSTPEEELVFQYHANLSRSNFWKRTDSILTAHPDNTGSAEIILGELCNAIYPLDRIESSFAKLDFSVQQSAAGKAITRYISSRKNSEPGATVANFSLKDSSGQLTQLKDIHADYVLLDFWFSSCKPCIQSFPNLINLYSRFKRNRFEIIGLSVDKKVSDWKSTVTKYRLPWINLHDGAQAVAFYTFAIENYPAQILLNSERQIVKINPSLDDVAKILEQGD